MPSKQYVGLGLSDLKKFKQNLINYKNGLNAAEVEIVKELVNTGVAELSNQLSAIPNLDGNDPGTVQAYTWLGTNAGSMGIISNTGPQVVYLEFGTGIPGEGSPHPQADSIGYLYNQKRSSEAHRTIDGVEGWFYKNDGMTEAVFTPGIKPGMQMWTTALRLRQLYLSSAKSRIKGAWS